MSTPDDKKAASPSAEAGSPSENAQSPAEDARERFRQALEAKKNRSHPSSGGAGKGTGVHGSDNLAASRRQFRRKSGSA